MNEEEVKQLRRFIDRFLATVSRLEEERDRWRDRFECLAYEVEDLIECSGGVCSGVFANNTASWRGVLEAGLLPSMVPYLRRRREQKRKQNKDTT